jgi:hypothetical protein
MKKFVLLLTFLLNIYGADCEAAKQARITKAEADQQEKIKQVENEFEQTKQKLNEAERSPAPGREICTKEKKLRNKTICQEKRSETPEEAKQFLINQLNELENKLKNEKEILAQFKNNPNLLLNETMHIHRGVNRNETSCADICRISNGIDISLNCPVAHSCYIEGG